MELITAAATTQVARPTRPHMHQPERGANESQQEYRARRAASQRAAARVVRGELVDNHIGHSRRLRVKAVGGIRQFKRLRYLANHPGYAERHPGMRGF